MLLVLKSPSRCFSRTRPLHTHTHIHNHSKLAMKMALKKVGRLEDLGGPGLIDGAILRLQERARQEKELPAPLQAEDLPTYIGGSLGSYKKGLVSLPRAAAAALKGRVRTGWTLAKVERAAAGAGGYICTFK